MTSPAGLLAFTVFLFDEGIRPVFFAGVGVAIALVLLFVLTRVLRHYFSRRVERMETPFGMSPRDLDKLRASGRLSEEEVKAIRRTMGKQFLERSEAQEAARKMPSKAEVALQLAEMEMQARREGEEKPEEKAQEEPPKPAPKPVESAPVPEPPEPEGERLPERLVALADKSDFELEEMVQAGFLTEDDSERIRGARGGGDG